MKSAIPTPFGERLLQAFENIPKSKIAKLLEVSNSTITDYISVRFPPPETLLRISDLTKCSIHWLLTGVGRMKIRANEAQMSLEEQEILEDEENSIEDVFLHLYIDQSWHEDIFEISNKYKTGIGEAVGFLVDKGCSAIRIEQAIKDYGEITRPKSAVNFPEYPYVASPGPSIQGKDSAGYEPEKLKDIRDARRAVREDEERNDQE